MIKVDVVVKNGIICTPRGRFESGVAIEEGKIVAIAKSSHLPQADSTIDAGGNLVMPGAIDGHSHNFDPWEPVDEELAVMMEDFVTGTSAAAAGGTTTVVDMPTTRPLVLNAKVFRDKKEILGKKAIVDFGLHGGFIPGMNYEKHIRGQWNEGALGVKTFMASSARKIPAIRDGDLCAALAVISKIDGLAILHAENDSIASYNQEKLTKEGRKDYEAFLEYRPPVVEIEAINRAIFFLKHTKARVLIAHTSVPEGVMLVKKAKDEGYPAYVETCPHYLYLTEEDVKKRGPWCFCFPPLRDKKRVAMLWELLNDGYIDIVSSDHAPLTRLQKEASKDDIWKTPAFGMPGAETMLPLMLKGVTDGRTTLERVISVVCENPARLFRIYPKKGALQIGSDADLVIIDLKKVKKIARNTLKTNCGWSPFEGWSIKGIPMLTMVRGSIVMENGEIVGKRGGGEFVPRQLSKTL